MTYQLFESIDDTEEVLSIVKDMLLDLNDSDFRTNAVIRRIDGVEYIRIGVTKGASFQNRALVPSFDWVDIKDTIEDVMDYLKSEGFEYLYNKGTLSLYYHEWNSVINISWNKYREIRKSQGSDHPYVKTYFQSVETGYRPVSKCEMWFKI